MTKTARTEAIESMIQTASIVAANHESEEKEKAAARLQEGLLLEAAIRHTTAAFPAIADRIATFRVWVSNPSPGRAYHDDIERSAKMVVLAGGGPVFGAGGERAAGLRAISGSALVYLLRSHTLQDADEYGEVSTVRELQPGLYEVRWGGDHSVWEGANSVMSSTWTSLTPHEAAQSWSVDDCLARLAALLNEELATTSPKWALRARRLESLLHLLQ